MGRILALRAYFSMWDWGDLGRILVGLNCALDLGAYFPQNHVRIRRSGAQVGALGRNLAVALTFKLSILTKSLLDRNC